tara:strand:- start:97 stop:783 length:687 start_codon:yes stop_codon:yes gene_type:complete
MTDKESMVNTDTADKTGIAEDGQDITAQVEKSYTKTQVNDMVAKRVKLMKADLASFDGVDVDEYNQLKNLKSEVEERAMMEQNNFEGVLKKHKDKSQKEITALRAELKTIRIDGALISSAAEKGSVNPEHVAQLLKSSVVLNGDGQTIIVDNEGKPRYNDDAEPMTVGELTEEFLSMNQYFRAAGPQGTGSIGNKNQADNQKIDLAQLDMNNASHREIYKKMKMEGKV